MRPAPPPDLDAAPSDGDDDEAGLGLGDPGTDDGVGGLALPHHDDGVAPEDRLPGVDYGERAHLHPDGSPRIVDRHLTVEPEVAGLRLDHFIKLKIPRMSRTRIQAVIERNLLRASGRPFQNSSRVVTGDVFTIRRAARAEPPSPRTFDVLHRDDDVLVIDKPAGLSMHSSAKFYFNTLTRVLLERYPDGPPQICHRIDRETSGVMVAAWTPSAAAAIKGAFAARRISKTYLAIVAGDPPWPDEAADQAPGGDEHVLDAPLRVAALGDPTKLIGVRMMPGPGGLPSVTRVCVRQRTGTYALVRCTPVTGRQHQIRAHLAHAGYPIIGDKLYRHGDDAFMAACDGRLDPAIRATLVLPRHALHAASIDLPHPTRGDRLRVVAPLPADMRRLLPAPGA